MSEAKRQVFPVSENWRDKFTFCKCIEQLLPRNSTPVGHSQRYGYVSSNRIARNREPAENFIQFHLRPLSTQFSIADLI